MQGSSRSSHDHDHGHGHDDSHCDHDHNHEHEQKKISFSQSTRNNNSGISNSSAFASKQPMDAIDKANSNPNLSQPSNKVDQHTYIIISFNFLCIFLYLLNLIFIGGLHCQRFHQCRSLWPQGTCIECHAG